MVAAAAWVLAHNIPLTTLTMFMDYTMGNDLFLEEVEEVMWFLKEPVVRGFFSVKSCRGTRHLNATQSAR